MLYVSGSNLIRGQTFAGVQRAQDVRICHSRLYIVMGKENMWLSSTGCLL